MERIHPEKASSSFVLIGRRAVAAYDPPQQEFIDLRLLDPFPRISEAESCGRCCGPLLKLWVVHLALLSPIHSHMAL